VKLIVEALEHYYAYTRAAKRGLRHRPTDERQGRRSKNAATPIVPNPTVIRSLHNPIASYHFLF
jgi:hypothetical protein